MATTLGRKIRRWTQDEIWKLHRFYGEGMARHLIAIELGMTEQRVKERLQWESRSPESKLSKRDRLRRSSSTWDKSMTSPRAFLDPVCGPKPTTAALTNRDLRRAAPARDLTAAFFGDPPVGFSALELRA